MTALWRALGAAVATAVLMGTVRASHVWLPVHASGEAVLRLAWSARPERIQRCRRPGPEEQADVPRHMRQDVVCEGTTAAYRLTVRRDGGVLAEQVVHGGGLRHDRRLYVFQEIALPSGEAVIDVRLDRLDPPAIEPPRDEAGASHPDAVTAPSTAADRSRILPGPPADPGLPPGGLPRHDTEVPPRLSFSASCSLLAGSSSSPTIRRDGRWLRCSPPRCSDHSSQC